MNETQKSKRDLKDVVGVFLSKSQVKEPSPLETSNNNPRLLDPQIITFCAPFSEDQTFAFNLLFPLCLSQLFKSRYLATHLPNLDDLNFANRLLERGGSEISEVQGKKKLANDYYWVHWADKKFFDDASSGLASSGLISQGDPLASGLVVVDLLRSNTLGFEQTLRVLDQLTLVIHPQIDDLKNAYKVIKACYYINRQIDVSIIFNAQMTQNEVEKVFARFSEIVSEFLVLPIRCLGAVSIDLNLKMFLERVPSQLSLETLLIPKLSKTKPKTSSLERIRFLQKIRTIIE